MKATRRSAQISKKMSWPLLGSLRRAASLSSVEMRQNFVRLGSSAVSIAYPQALHPWFDGRAEPADADVAQSKWVRLSADEALGSFEVHTSVDCAATELNLGDALATFWERVSFLLVDDLHDSLALHAAALSQEKRIVLIPGQTGSGKTRLSLWYRTQGFELGTDEITILPLSLDCETTPFLGGALPRPVILKTSVDPSALLRPGETAVAQEHSY